MSRRFKRRRRSTAARRLSRWWFWPVVIILLGAFIYVDNRGWLLAPRSDEYDRYHNQTAFVLRVIDGDTIDIDIPDILRDRPFTRVRLWGIDAPELDRLDKPGEPYAEESLRHLRALIGKREVVLELEEHSTRGDYNRVLAHIRTEESDIANAVMLEAGLARFQDRWPHSRLSEYQRAENQARAEKRGIWSQSDR